MPVSFEDPDVIQKAEAEIKAVYGNDVADAGPSFFCIRVGACQLESSKSSVCQPKTKVRLHFHVISVTSTLFSIEARMPPGAVLIVSITATVIGA